DPQGRARTGAAADAGAGLPDRVRAAAVRDHRRRVRQGVPWRGAGVGQDGKGGEGDGMNQAGSEAEIEQDRRQERFLIRVTLAALAVMGMFLLVRQVL